MKNVRKAGSSRTRQSGYGWGKIVRQGWTSCPVSRKQGGMKVRKFIWKHRNDIVCLTSVAAVFICVLTAKEVTAKQEETILFTVSAVWLAIVILVNWKKLWKGR